MAEALHLISSSGYLYRSYSLNREKPHDLPVVQATKLQLIINLKTAQAFSITVPLPLFGRVDEVIDYCGA